jgi:hypothetical protein
MSDLMLNVANRFAIGLTLNISMCISIMIQKGCQLLHVLKSLLKKTDQRFVAKLEVFKVERNMELENICEVRYPPITL